MVILLRLIVAAVVATFGQACTIAMWPEAGIWAPMAWALLTTELLHDRAGTWVCLVGAALVAEAAFVVAAALLGLAPTPHPVSIGGVLVAALLGSRLLTRQACGRCGRGERRSRLKACASPDCDHHAHPVCSACRSREEGLCVDCAREAESMRLQRAARRRARDSDSYCAASSTPRGRGLDDLELCNGCGKPIKRSIFESLNGCCPLPGCVLHGPASPRT